MKTLVISAHPDIESSKVNKVWKRELLKYPDEITIHELYKEYPDWNIDAINESNIVCVHFISSFKYWNEVDTDYLHGKII